MKTFFVSSLVAATFLNGSAQKQPNTIYLYNWEDLLSDEIAGKLSVINGIALSQKFFSDDSIRDDSIRDEVTPQAYRTDVFSQQGTLLWLECNATINEGELSDPVYTTIATQDNSSKRHAPCFIMPNSRAIAFSSPRIAIEQLFVSVSWSNRF